MITPEQIYEATNRGLDIIKSFYPEAREDGKKFKCRNEDDASACIKLFNNVWKLTDFGDDGHSLSPIDIVMKEANLTFPKAIAYMANRFGVEDTSIREANKAVIEQRPAKEDEKEGDFRWQGKEFTDYELKILGPKVTAEICEAYSYKSVAWYSRTRKAENGNLVTTVVSSTATFPIFLRDCGEFQKIYTPLNWKKEFRFSYAGKKPHLFINGLKELKEAAEAYEASQGANDPDTEGESKPARKKSKYPEAVICCGERDALCCAAFGYKPIWFNSETYHLSEAEYAQIAGLVETLYYIPDLDYTGRKKAIELGLRFLNIHLVWLPEWLHEYRDSRGKPRKDLRDYSELAPDIAGFKKLMQTGMPLKFWQRVVETKDGVAKTRYEINSSYLIHFLRCMGFGIYKGDRGEEYVQIVNNKVKSVTPGDVRRFIIRFAEQQSLTSQEKNAILNSARVSANTFDVIGEVSPNFTRCTPSSQNFYFDNGVVKVSEKDVVLERWGNGSTCVWENAIVPHRFKRREPAFTIWQVPGFYAIDCKDKSSHFFRYLIQTSRMYWREELEYRAGELDEAARERYRERNRFEIAGDLLTEDERREQIHHLVNKIFTVGYLLHRYKFANRAWIAYAMDARVSNFDEANGRTGKSFFMKAVANLLSSVSLSGRNEHLTENPHVLDRVTRHTDMVLVDDAYQYLDLGFFFDNTTGDMVVNPKRLQSYCIPFEESPKIAITTNYSPTKQDSSTQARLLYMAFSDYYHYNGEGGRYREDRDIFSDFGMTLMDSRYPEEAWNEDFNFMFDCLQFYLGTIAPNVKIDPPMDRIKFRTNKLIMGENFEDWAAVYFSPQSGNLDNYLVRERVFNDFCMATRNNKWSGKKFSKALAAFCENNSLVLNPAEACNSDNRIIRWMEGGSKECYYIHVPDTPFNLDNAIVSDNEGTGQETLAF
ncbi:MAG: hypothetical protein NC324_02235 [Bacteroides sp.]|nr:hypothetical protein [Bacteroides sp.]